MFTLRLEAGRAGPGVGDGNLGQESLSSCAKAWRGEMVSLFQELRPHHATGCVGESGQEAGVREVTG